MKTRALALGICSLLTLAVVAAGLQPGSTPQRANAAALPSTPTGSCAALSTSGSTHTAGGGALVISAGLDKLTSDSDVIVGGTVTSFRTCIDRTAGGLSTDVTVRVTEHVKSPPGAASASDVTFNVPGGQYGQLALYVGTSPEFSAGEQVVVFLQNAGGDLRLTGGFQGKFSVARNGEAAGWGEAAYALNGTGWYPEDRPVPYYLNADEGIPPQLSAAGVQSAWTNAFDTWQNDPGSDISFSPQGATTRDSGDDECGPSMPDGYNDLTWGIDVAHDSSVLAVTFSCAWILPGIDQLIYAYIEFDADAGHFLNDWRTDGTGSCASSFINLESVTLHEAGHFIGLDHPSSNSCGSFGGCPVMNASYQGVGHNLCQDDRDSVAALYPADETPTTTGGAPTNTPTNTPTAAPPTNTPTNTPTTAPPTNTPTVAPPTNTPTPAPPTNTPEASATPVPATGTPTSTETPAPVATATFTPTPIAPTATPTETPPAVDTPTLTPAATDPPTETPTPSLTSTPTRTATRTPTRTPTHVPPPASIPGDANCDGNMNSLDALAILQFSAGLIDSLPCPDEADVNGNGRVDSLDAALVLQFVAGLVDEL